MNIYYSKASVKSNRYQDWYRHFTIQLFFILTSFLLSCNSGKSGIDLDGVWETKIDQKNVTFRFAGQDCQIIVMSNQGEIEKNFNGEFTIDNKKQPFSISINKIEELNHALYSIVKIVGSDSIVIAKFSPKWRLRPINFDPESSFKLKRIIDEPQFH